VAAAKMSELLTYHMRYRVCGQVDCEMCLAVCRLQELKLAVRAETDP
jgi:hypothetical protein